MSLKQQLFKELGTKTLISTLIFASLFVVLEITEMLIPSLQGELLRWNDMAFVVGIPASILGIAYVMTITNPNNYTGFYLGFIMSFLLAWQFYIMGKMDQVIIYLCIFFPFQIASFYTWRSNTLHPSADAKPFVPAFLTPQKFALAILSFIGIAVLDYALLSTIWSDETSAGFSTKICEKSLCGICMAASFMANFLMIFKKNDAWICWVIYSIVNIALFCIYGNIFSIVLFVVMGVINAKAQFAWLRMTDANDFEWAGSKEYINALRNKLYRK